jgi:hypothetical protein
MGFMFSRPVGSSESKRIQSILEQISITDTTSPIFRMIQQLQEEQSRASSGDGSYESNDILVSYSLRDLANQSMFTFKREKQRDFYAVRPVGETQRGEWKKHSYLRGLKKDEIQRIYRIYHLLILILGLTSLMTLEYTSSVSYAELTGRLNQNNHHLYKLFKYIRLHKGDSVPTGTGTTPSVPTDTKPKESTTIPYLKFIGRFSTLFIDIGNVYKKESSETLLSVPPDIVKELHTKNDNFEKFFTLRSYNRASILKDMDVRSDKFIPTSDTQWLTFLETLFTLDTLGFCSSDNRYRTMIEGFSAGSTTDLAVFVTDFLANLFGKESKEFKPLYTQLVSTFSSYLRSKELLESSKEEMPIRSLLQKPYSELSKKLKERCSLNNPLSGIINARSRSSESAIQSPFVDTKEGGDSAKSEQKRKIPMSSSHMTLVKEYNDMIVKLRASVISGFHQVFVVDTNPDAYKVVFSFKDKPIGMTSTTSTSTSAPIRFLALKNQISLSSDPEKILLGILGKMLINMFATHSRMIQRTLSILDKDLPAISRDYLKKPENVLLLQSSAQKQSGFLYES